jgi:hypothetical protein
MSDLSAPLPRFLEHHRLTWGCEDADAVFERIDDARFRTTLMAAVDPPNGASPAGWTVRPELPRLDGVAAAEIICGDKGYGFFSLELVLTKPLPRIDFPWSRSPAPPGEISFDDALSVAEALGYPIDPHSIRATSTFFLFPVYQIGTCAVLIEKRSGRVVKFGSAFPVDDWLWGYENSLLEEPPSDLVIVDVMDRERAIKLLNELRYHAANLLSEAEIRASLPIILRSGARWMAIPHLRKLGDSVRWEVRRGDRRESK